MTTFDELFAEHNLTPKERKALVMHLATLRAQKTVEALQDGPPAAAPSTPPPAVVEVVPIPDCTVADVGFRWDMEAQRHVPQVLVEFEPTPPNSPVDAKGWKDRNAFAAFVKSRGIAPKAAQEPRDA